MAHGEVMGVFAHEEFGILWKDKAAYKQYLIKSVKTISEEVPKLVIATNTSKYFTRNVLFLLKRGFVWKKKKKTEKQIKKKQMNYNYSK